MSQSSIVICKSEILVMVSSKVICKIFPHYIFFWTIILKAVVRQNELRSMEERVQSSKDTHYYSNSKDAHWEWGHWYRDRGSSHHHRLQPSISRPHAGEQLLPPHFVSFPPDLSILPVRAAKPTALHSHVTWAILEPGFSGWTPGGGASRG